MTVAKSSKILKGAEAIAAYIHCGRGKAIKLISLGMPANLVDGTWFAYSDNIDEYFRRVTLRLTCEINEDAE